LACRQTRFATASTVQTLVLTYGTMRAHRTGPERPPDYQSRRARKKINRHLIHLFFELSQCRDHKPAPGASQRDTRHSESADSTTSNNWMLPAMGRRITLTREATHYLRDVLLASSTADSPRVFHCSLLISVDRMIFRPSHPVMVLSSCLSPNRTACPNSQTSPVPLVGNSGILIRVQP